MISLAEFLEGSQESLNQVVLQQFRPHYNFDLPDSVLGRLKDLKRAPFTSQAHAIAALLHCLVVNNSNSGFLVGEMGVGKSLIGIAVAHASKFKKILVVCPPHLVEKWKREVERTVPMASVAIIRSITDFERVVRSSGSNRQFFILSRERAKLGYRWSPAFVMQQKGTEWKYRIPCCPACGNEILDEEGIPLESDLLSKRKLQCSAKILGEKGERVCGNPLWQADGEGPRRYSLAEYIKRRYRKYIDLLVLDEVHEYKAKGSAQGYAAAALASASKKVLALTGTIFGGYSTSLFHLLYRLSQSIKTEYSHNDEMRFASHYGILERITNHPDILKEEGSTSKRRSYNTRIVERPGVSPAIITKLLDKSVFLRLSDTAENLPPYEDVVETINMEQEQVEEYEKFSAELEEALKKEIRKGNKRLLGVYLQSLLAYPDMPWREESIYVPEKKGGHYRNVLVAHAKALPEERLYPKEERLIELCREQKAKGRKVAVYCVHTNKRDITGRIRGFLEKAGIRVAVLKSTTTKSEKREKWIKDQVKQDIDVLICHPRLVQTGLDLLDFPTLVFYQLEYSVYTLRQASRRSWRHGQKNPVEVHYFVYERTLQARALQLIATKTKASLAVEGELVEGGLSAFSEEDDMTTQLAKSLVKNNTGTETAEQLFRAARAKSFDNDHFIQEPEHPEIIDLKRVQETVQLSADKIHEEDCLSTIDSDGQRCFAFV